MKRTRTIISFFSCSCTNYTTSVTNYGVDASTVNGFRGWKDGRELIDAHCNGIDHNKSRKGL